MMFLTLALSVMAMGSAMANDSFEAKSGKPNKVKIEINHNCCGDHGNRHFDMPKGHKHGKHLKSNCKVHKYFKPECPACEHAKYSHKGGKPQFNGKPHSGKPGAPGNFAGPEGRPEGRPNGLNGRPGGRF